ncbi:MAG: bifunctional UDP-3-O-[3-hydroxymyristoyl] N-acetylglucosamine deacetylase/3-hydroxyacyl-ACP dehydratase [Chitinivibrionales bacterium]|nr:bifunctional UDP-3-O-[3-hydroxymyristoyl] N-acetylglucosamine deacetylase/3-hydroxyacyl-ACP dehydratase [Chitinivibrionales bacterium]
MALQHTIKKVASLSGIGLHTGDEAKVTINPAPENYGITFVRTDLNDSPVIEADIDNVVELERGTTIGKDGVSIKTIEHLMAALAGLEIDNCLVEVEAPELPLMDGSALPFVQLIQNAGIQEQPAQREFLKIEKPILLYQDNDTGYSIFPMDQFHITLMIDYSQKNPMLSSQHTTMFSLDDFAKEFAPARTFCFLSEIEMLREKGLIRGGTLDSAVVMQDVDLTQEHIEYIRKLFEYSGPIEPGKNGFLNNAKLRFYNELCRHKALDLIGDLYLLGKPILGHVLAARTSHASNHMMAKKIREKISKHEKQKAKEQIEPQVSYQDILEILPHRYPFLLIDNVIEIEPGKKIIATKNVSFNDPFFQGHFPGDPVMPGVLQIESMAQAGGIMGLFSQKMSKDKAIAFLGIDKARFREMVRPGDQLRIECELLQNRRGTIRFAGKCFVGDKIASEAELFAMLTAKK